MPKGEQQRKKLAALPGADSPESSSYPQHPPKGNVGRCSMCKRMLDACLIEISRRTPTEGIVAQRAYACREHAAEVAEKIVRDLASWTTWIRPEVADGS